MDAASERTLKGILGAGGVGTLATLREGGPNVAMVLCAPDGEGAFLIHVSQLASHTQDLLENPKAALLLGGRSQVEDPQMQPRVAIRGEAEVLAKDSPDGQKAAGAYLASFPKAEDYFGLGDFILFRIRPRSVRFVGGFARAFDVEPEEVRKFQKT